MKIFTMPIYFFRELIFDSKEEYDIKSTSFNTKKVLTFLIVVISIALNIAMTIRVISMALDIVEHKATIEILQGCINEKELPQDKEPETKASPTRSPK